MNTVLSDLVGINRRLIKAAQTHHPHSVATLDQDATLCPTARRSALYCYKNFKSCQPFNTYWHEQGILLHSEFRDGNVPAGFEQLRLIKESPALLPVIKTDEQGNRILTGQEWAEVVYAPGFAAVSKNGPGSNGEAWTAIIHQAGRWC